MRGFRPLDRIAEDKPLPADVKNLDLITFFFYYHDTTYMEVNRDKMNKAMFDALKPGAFLIIADHSAKPGEGTTVGKTTHRIEEKTLIEEVTKAGFKHVGTLPQVGFKFGRWLDLSFYQLLLETPAHPLDG